mgnify:CR=1 FL=1
MQTRITELLNIKYPIFQGGMAWVADGDLAGAVSNAGGLGIIGGGNAPKEVVKANIDKVKSITDKPFGVNIMLLSPFADDIVDLVIEEGVKVVTTGAGNPGKYMDRFHEAGITVIPVVPSVALAKRMEKLGADAVIAEGMEAGGHIGKLTTMTLVRQVVEAVSIPVIGAGGVADGAGAAAVFMLGAEAVQVGTRFVVAKESNAHQNFKNKILKAKDIDTVVSASVVGHPVRAIKNKLASAYNQAERDFLAGKKTQEEIEELAKKVETEPEKREAQRRLAEEVTRFVHSEEDLKEAQKITQALFSGNIKELNAEEIAQGFGKMPNVEISSTPENIVELLVSTKIEPSKRQAREDVSNGAISINGDRVTDLNFVINPSDEFDGKFVVIRKGKKNYFLAKVID